MDQVAGGFEQFVSDQKNSSVPRNLRGMPITVEARRSEKLHISAGARANTRGLKLLNVRRASRTEGEVAHNSGPDRAVFFVTSNTLKSLRENIEAYGEWEDEEDTFGDLNIEESEEGGRRPRNFWLFESGDTIRPATLRDFWVDALDKFPRRKAKAEWEVWLRPDLEKFFLNALNELGLETFGRPTHFVETTVRNIRAAPEELQSVLRASGAIVALRSASSFASDFNEMEPEQRAVAVASLAGRVLPSPPGAPRIAILDTGVNRSHQLLQRLLPSDRCYTVEGRWGRTDHHGHGTRMAGAAQFGDLDGIGRSTRPLHSSTVLESVVVTPPPSGPIVPARDAIQEAVRLIEREASPRLFCLAQTAAGEAEDGTPTSTSAVLDALAYGDGQRTRLFCVAVGNAPHTELEPYQKAAYDSRNAGFGVQSPAQALNALAVGAVALKELPGVAALSPTGDLAPTSRTSESWKSFTDSVRFCKPDIVMEGGNFLVDEGDVFCRPSPRHMVMTTGKDAPARPFAMSGETSTATALASGLAARLLAQYPQMRMETIRALMVNSADWTPAMLAHQRRAAARIRPSDAYAFIISRFGWGVPNEDRLFASADNALTLVAEDDLEPYENVNGNIRLKEMKYFKLPWPGSVLRDLGTAQVEMRCTLSYFVEPEPHSVSRDRLERYPSHRLRFDVKRAGESDASAQHRLNTLAPHDDSGGYGLDDGWLLGERQRGSLVHDIWRGEAYRLADRDGISVSPIRGWWGDIKAAERFGRKVNFSLVVSIRTPPNTGDLVAAATANIPVRLLVEPIKALT
ncbi:S8 family peptidase [Mesorhizobium sp. BHbdii]